MNKSVAKSVEDDIAIRDRVTRVESDLRNSVSWLRPAYFAQLAGIFAVIALIVGQTYFFNKQLNDINSKISLIQTAFAVLTVEVQDIKGDVKNLDNRLDNIEKYLGIRP